MGALGMKKLHNLGVASALIATFSSIAFTQLLPMEQSQDSELCIQEKAAISFLEQLGDLSDTWILEVGCGRGNVAAWMARTAEAVLALDGQAMIDLAKSTHGQIKNLGLISISDLAKFVVDGPYTLRQSDLITSFFWLDWSYFQGDLFQDLYADLKPGGQILLTISPDKYFNHSDDFMQGLEGCGFESIVIEHKNIAASEILLVSARKPCG